MTDTTDIKALRERLASLNRTFGLISSPATMEQANTSAYMFVQAGGINHILAALDQLEAERHRADASHKYGNDRDAENESLMLTVGRLRAELAALKGDQVPVEYQQRTKPKWDDHHPWSDWEKCSEGTYNDLVKANLEICDWIHEVRELFTAPQKPVVLLPVAEDYPIAWSAASVLADVKAAIESAGGIVKDGE